MYKNPANDLTPAEFAKTKRVSVKHVYQKLSEGSIPGAYRVKHIWLIPPTATIERKTRLKISNPQPAEPA